MSVDEEPNEIGIQGFKLGERTTKALSSYVLARTAHRVVRDWWTWHRNRQAYNIRIYENDFIYTPVLMWVASTLDQQRIRSLRMEWNSDRDTAPETIDDDWDTVSPRGNRKGYGTEAVLALYDDNTSGAFMFRGHRILVTVLAEDQEVQNGIHNFLKIKEKELVFTVYSLEARDAIVEHIKAMGQELVRKSKQLALLYAGDSYGNWHRKGTVTPRPIETVITAGSEREDIIADIEQFLGEQKQYQHLGAPWHRGYLFYGPPGTGKTSMARAVACHFNMNLYYLSLAGLQGDSRLLQMVSSVSPRSILLIEDIDTVSAATDRQSDAEYVTMSGLLNALDGVATPEGLITILSSNYPEKLDSALVREGRVDMKVEFGHATAYQIEKIVLQFTGQKLHLDKEPEKISVAAVTEIIKKNLRTPELVTGQIKEMVANG